MRTPEQLAESLDVDLAVIRYEIQKMLKSGYLIVARRGKPSLYTMPDGGRSLCRALETDPEPTIPGARIVAARHTHRTGPGECYAWLRANGASC